MKSDIHQLALGCCEILTRKIEQDTQTSEIWEDLKPAIGEIIKDYLPNQFVEVNPLLGSIFKIGMKIKDKRQKCLEQPDSRLLTP